MYNLYNMNLPKKPTTSTTMNNIHKICSGIVTNMITSVENHNKDMLKNNIKLVQEEEKRIKEDIANELAKNNLLKLVQEEEKRMKDIAIINPLKLTNKPTTSTTMNNIHKICSGEVTNMIMSVEKHNKDMLKNNMKLVQEEEKRIKGIAKELAKNNLKLVQEKEKRNKYIAKELAKNNMKLLLEEEKRNKYIAKNNIKLVQEEEKRMKHIAKDIAKNNLKLLREEEKLKKMYKKRKRCEHPCTELLCGLVLCNATMSIQNIVNMTYEDLQQFPALKVDIIDFNGYIEDLKYRLDVNEYTGLQKYISKFTEDYRKYDWFGKIKNIYIVGKNNKFKEVATLNEHVKDKKDAKGDIIVRLEDDVYFGLSVKAGKHATKSNYSIMKYFNDVVVKECQEKRLEYLTASGFPIFNKEDRPEVNKLFHDRFNPMFQKFREEVLKEDIGRQLVDSLYGVNLQYDIYEFDGNELVLLTNRNIDYESVSFLECPEYYLKNSGINRNAAKMFFKLQCGDAIYRVELRWKGVIHTAWPQFQIHSI